MRRFLRFLILFCLRALVVGCLTFWAIASLTTIGVGMQLGNRVLHLTMFRQGVAASLVRPEVLSPGFYVLGRSTSWDLVEAGILRASHQNVPGFHYWSQSAWGIRVGVAYPAAIIVLIICYLLVSKWGKGNRHAKFQKRLLDAESKHIQRHG